MMLSASPTALAKSSLEEMLETLRRQDEDEKPKDLPPALPSRPTSKARLPSARRSLPTNFKLVSNGENGCGFSEVEGKEESKRKEEELGEKRDVFGSKKLRKIVNVDSPYDLEAVVGKKGEDKVSDAKAEVNEMQKGKAIWKKLRVWCRQSNGAWESGAIQSTSGEESFVSLSNGNVVKASTSELLPANPEILEGVNDMIELSYLNEPSVLHNLKYRYARDMIYSKAGPVLIAVNPYKDVQIYGKDFVTSYREKATDSPHVFAIVDTAYNEMMNDGVNQSIIISGESGAGKTETAKFAMQYLAALGGGNGKIVSKILETHCILQAFGNAKTSRNDNSSRFGKLTEVHFTESGKISGANIQTCEFLTQLHFMLSLLSCMVSDVDVFVVTFEQSRVVQVAAGERSYHIFYQLCAGAPLALRERLNLKMANEYNYLIQSDNLVINGVDDAQKFHKLVEALDTVQICKEQQEQAFAMLAAVLWLGDVSFQLIDDEHHVEALADEALTSAARLMGCATHDLMQALSTHGIRAAKDNIAKKSTLQQAIDTRDALAKFIYASLFDWLVVQINKSLEVGKRCVGRSISILDIYGFESFKKNSFEQFCINYANERLQQHFNRHLFKLEQEEYVMDGIDWAKVDFVDNQECLDLFEKKPLGILSLLDEESNFPNATDFTLANKLKQHLHSNSYFKGDRGRAFGVRHFAGEVLYDTNGFLEKNRDPLNSGLVQLLSSCSGQLPQSFAKKVLDQSLKPGISSDAPKQSVGMKFKGQLFELMHQLEKTTPHFICCIKPNCKQVPDTYDEDLVLQQLRYCGVLEVVRISKSGYPTQMTHQDFAERYGFLLLETNASHDPLSISVSLLKQFNVLPEMYQVGYTKLFLRTGQIGALEDRRKKVLRGVIGVQKYFRGHRARRLFLELNKGAKNIQSFVCGESIRRKYASEANRCSAFASQLLDEQLTSVIYLQSVIRGWLARRHFSNMHNSKQLNRESIKSRRKTGRKLSEAKETLHEQQIQVVPSVMADLQRRVLKAEATLGKKEQENTTLREQLQQHEARWLDYEAKMKSMEDMWQKQMASLQTSLAAARKSLAADSTAGQLGRADVVSPSHYYSEDNVSMGSRTPGMNTPVGGRENGSLNAVGNLLKEFDQAKQAFDDDAKSLVEIRTPQPTSDVNPDDELRRLKGRFETWKKDFKMRLKETKARLHKRGHQESDKTRRKWWGKLGSRSGTSPTLK
ncbi:ARABIDOPSIS THALIANA MYOSIN 1, myosin 2, ARABIDOPSIS THALIANA MYOSIN 4 [Hibiscus trionum]|uniref:ARABIDOPSIS THALIANA MYOSIN 1, myosin 2, ARABIDOPSIS THALIANA MYOSIN 4 n=1 Tax=Hibiscus trionum TaxID=183268 RepID=A0A9W7MPS5_HIBTR|nr:ARABIDOPSIS THALIANA MYOSIN 1, myosin 2, ARABIDOPSIS THALIANA MYOSIN 4 [Hibiscus trionum]